MKLGEIESSLYDTLGFQSTPDGSVTRKLRREINLAHRQLLTKRQLSTLRRKTLSFTSVANSDVAVLPQAAVHIAAIVDRTNRLTLDPISLQEVRFRDPGRAFTGAIPDSYCLETWNSPVALDPSAASQLFVISDSASDATGLNAYIEGIITGGYYRKANVAMSGLTAVALDSAVTWEIITKFYISGPAKGNVTLHQTSGVGTELARITSGRSYARYTRLILSDIPGSSITYWADVEIHVEDMVNPNDEPLLPEDFHWLLECGALRKEWQKKEKIQLWRVEEARWIEGKADLLAWMARQGKVSSGGQRSSAGRQSSQLGWNYPAGS